MSSACPLSRAEARVLASEIHDDMDPEFVSRDGLSIGEAWEMATAWNEELLGHVQATSESVELRLSCGSEEDARKRAKAARAAVTVWRALAACRGFGTVENAAFWKRVFNDVQAPRCACFILKSWHLKLDARVTDKDSVPEFTRVQLDLSKVTKFYQVHDRVMHFVGWNGDALDERAIETLRRLAPLTRKRTRVDPVEIVLQVSLNFMHATQVNDLAHAIQVGTPRSVVPRVPVWMVPLFVMRAVDVADHCVWGCSSNTLCLDYARGLNVRTLRRTLRISSKMDTTTQRKWASWLKEALCVKAARTGGVETLRFTTPEAMDAICSALPHTRSLNTLHIPLDGQTRTDAAWLGYALFHPDSASSTWRQLWLETDSTVTHEYVDMLRLMAKGNNLHSALAPVIGDSSTVVEGYLTATLRPGTVIYYQANRGSEVVGTSWLSVDVCGVMTSTDPTVLPKWVLVIVPCVGVAWVQSADIERIASRSPAAPFLSSLRFMDDKYSVHDNLYSNYPATLMATIIELTGRTLESLDVTGRRGMDLQLTRERLLDCCPRLRHLTIGDSERVDPLHGFTLPAKLETLELRFTKKEVRFAGSALCHLRTLQAVTIVPYDGRADHCSERQRQPPSDEDMQSFVYPLLRKLPTVQRFRWLGAEDEGYLLNMVYPFRRFVSRAVFSALVPGVDDVAVVPTVEATVALLSVVRHYASDKHAAVGGLTNETLEIIAGFAKSSVKREFWVQGERPGDDLVGVYGDYVSQLFEDYE